MMSRLEMDQQLEEEEEEEIMRRQEMSDLYSSLRSLLPLDYIRGKQPLLDDLEEAARYVKELEKNVKDLEHKRDKLKKLSSENQCEDLASSSRITNQLNSDNHVTIHVSSNGVEIEIISTKVGGDDPVFPLSLVLEVILEEGLNVISCVSSKINQRSIYVFHCQVNGEKFVDSSRLQGRLTSQISS